MSKRRSSFESDEQKIYLGGLISEEHEVYKRFSMKNTEGMFCVWFLEHLEDLLTSNPIDMITKILEQKALLDYLAGCTELSQLSMKIGDIRPKTGMKNIQDGLDRIAKHASSG